MKQLSFLFLLCHLFFSPVTATPPGPFGTIYSKNAWTATTDFITNGNASAVLSGNYVNISSASAYNWNNTVHITDYHTKLEKWNFKLRFKIMAWAANSYGMGIGLKSANQNVQNDVLGFIQTTNAGTGGLYILQSNQNILAAGSSPLGVALNDVIELEAILYDSLFTFHAINITSGNSRTMSYTFSSNGSTPVIPNTSHFTLLELGGTHQLQDIQITSPEIARAAIVTVGDSKTAGYFATTFSGRYAAQLNKNYAPAVVNAGGADRVTHALARQDELVRLDASKYLLCIGSNDLRFGTPLTTLQSNYGALVSALQSTGAAVYHILIPEDYSKALGINQVAFRDWIAATYGSFYINGVWDSLATGDKLKGIYDSGDGVHLTQSANDKIYEALIASGKLNATTLPVKLYSFEAKMISEATASVKWTADPLLQAESYVLQKSSNGNSFHDLATVKANETGRYDHTDQSVVNGDNYYRLRMTEANGEISYSRIILLRNKQPGIVITGFINENEPTFKLMLPAPATLGWQVVDANGRIIKNGRQYFSTGPGLLQISISNFQRGVYYLRIYDGKSEAIHYPFLK